MWNLWVMGKPTVVLITSVVMEWSLSGWGCWEYVSQEICLVVKEFEGTFKSVKLGFLILVKTIEAKRVLLWTILMSYLTDRNDVWFRWWALVTAENRSLPSSFWFQQINQCGGKWSRTPISIIQCTSPTCALVSIAFSMEFKTSSTKALKRWSCSSSYQCWLAKDLQFVPCLSWVRNSLKCSVNLSGWQHKGTVIFLSARSVWRLCFFFMCISIQPWVIASDLAESSLYSEKWWSEPSSHLFRERSLLLKNNIPRGS